MGPYMLEVEFRCLRCCSSLFAWDKKCHFVEVTYHYPYCIMFLWVFGSPLRKSIDIDSQG
jgi:hypothetical protein